MWILSSIESQHKLYILNDKETYTVGRVQHDLILLGDTSVSRDHANIYRSPQGISVEDKSRYGVFINKGIETNKGIGTGSKVKLKVGDAVRFGRLKSIFRLEKIEFKVCCSMMTPADVTVLAKRLQIVDGKLQNSWHSECTHLVMSTIVVTMKVLQSLIQGIPIVTPAYYDALIKYARENRSDLPNVNDFVPEITEPFLVNEPGSMQVHLDRQRIFQGKTFVFMVKRHMANFRSVIELAAGKCVSLEEDRLSKKSLLKENYIPVAYSPVGESQCSDDVNGIVSYVEGNNRRLILEAEIGLAIIHRSIERFCNPDHKTAGDFQVSTLNTNELRVNILVDNTPNGSDSYKMISPGSQPIIPETVNSESETEPNNNLNDNKMVEEEIHFDSEKPSTSKKAQKSKPATPIKSPTTRASSKRKLNAVDDVEKEPSDEVMDTGTRSKKAKQTNTKEREEETAVSSQMSSLSSDLMPPPSSSIVPQSQSQPLLDSSGFISTQHRKRTANECRVELEKTKELTKEQKDQHRKRAIAQLNADSDDENVKDDEDDELFKFSKKPAKKPKMALRNSESRIGKKRTFVGVSDDDSNDDNPFQFSKSKVMRSQQSQKKKRTDRETESKSIDMDTPDHAMMDNENSFTTTRKTEKMKSKTTTTLDIKGTSIVSTDWITSKIIVSLNLNGTKQNVSKEKKEKGESFDEEKHSWVKSLANVFQTRRIDVNLSRNLVIDETDSVSISETTSSTLNKSKNFKKFVKKNNYTQSSVTVKTTSTPVVISAYSRL